MKSELSQYSARELAKYLARSRVLYKTGIPLRSMSAAPQGEAFLFVTTEAESETADFFKALIENGLKSELSAHRFMQLTDDKAENKTLSEGGSSKAVVFGARAAGRLDLSYREGECDLVSRDQINILIAPEVSEIRSKPALKKQFWSMLKSL